MRILFIILVALCAFVTSSPALAAVGNTIKIWSVAGSPATLSAAPTDTEGSLSDGVPNGFTHARFYVSGGNSYVFMLKRQNGEAQIRSAAGGTIGSIISRYDLGDDWTHVDTYSSGGVTYLVLHRSRTGEVDRYVLGTTGFLGTRTAYGPTAGLRDKSDFSIYDRSNTLYWSATDRWTGRSNFYTASTGAAQSAATWSTGWSSVDYVKHQNNTTYRILVKPLATPGNERGRLVTQSVAANGQSGGTIRDQNLTDPKWTHVRFVTSFFGGVWTPRVFLYAAKDGAWSINSFSTTPGVGVGGSVSSGMIDENIADFDVYTQGTTAYIMGVIEDDKPVLTNTQLDAIGGGGNGSVNSGSSINGVMTNANIPGGWQAALMQSGRLMLKASGGMINRSTGTLMDDTTHNINWGSVTKLMTAITLVKLADRQEIDLDAPIESYMFMGNGGYADHEDFASDTEFLTTREVIEYTSGLARDGDSGCSENSNDVWAGAEMEVGRNCAGCISNPDGSETCPRGYTNSVWNLGRDVIGWTMGLPVPPENDVVANDYFVYFDLIWYLRALWWDRVGSSEMQCWPEESMHGLSLDTSAQHYYTTAACPTSEEYCGPVDGYPTWNAVNFLDEDNVLDGDQIQGPWVCSTGGLVGRAEEMARMLQGLRGNRVLTPDWEKYITNAPPNAPAASFCAAPPAGVIPYAAGWFGSWAWNDPLTGTCEIMRSKFGRLPNKIQADVARLFYGADATIVTNTDAPNLISNLLPNAWNNMGS